MSRWGSANFDALLELEKRLEGADGTKMKVNYLQTVGGLCLRSAMFHTPVDTGTLRANWRVSKPYGSGNSTLSIDVFNNTEYAMFVEYGHRTRDHSRWIEGRFMLEKAKSETNRKIPSIEQKVVGDFLKGL